MSLFDEKLKEYIAEASQRLHKEQERYTREEVEKLFLQFLLSGDCVQYVQGEGRKIVYIPYREAERLRNLLSEEKNGE